MGTITVTAAASGVHPKVAQVLARHSTITLTMDHYTHLELHDHAEALDKLPRIPPALNRPRPSGKGKRTPALRE
jgi:hypothetical protein